MSAGCRTKVLSCSLSLSQLYSLDIVVALPSPRSVRYSWSLPIDMLKQMNGFCVQLFIATCCMLTRSKNVTDKVCRQESNHVIFPVYLP